MRHKFQIPTPHPLRQHRVGLATNPPKINAQAVADTGVQTDILSLTTLESLGFDPDTLLETQVRVTRAVRGAQLDIRGGIFLSVYSPDHSDYRHTVHLFYVASNISQNYLSCSCLEALSEIGQDSPRIGATTSSTPRPTTPTTKDQQRYSETLLRIAPRSATAYTSCQIDPRTPRTTPSCSSESPSNCPVQTLLGNTQQQLQGPLPNRKPADPCKAPRRAT